MKRILARQAGRLDAVYAGQPFFVVLKARLLAALLLITLGFIPINLLKLFWVRPAYVPWRLAINAIAVAATLLALRRLWRGHLQEAANVLALTIAAGMQLILLVGSRLETPLQPLSVAIQLFAFNLVLLLFAVAFGARWAGAAVFGLVCVSMVAFHVAVVHPFSADPQHRLAADALLRDGLLATTLFYCLGLAVTRMIEIAHRRSEEARRETERANAALEQRVADRTRALELATRKAEESSRAKSQFLANMSHELRTPLNGVIASADLLQRRTDLPAAAREQARLIVDSGDLLLRLVSEILDLSRIDAGRMDLQRQPFELAAVVGDAVALSTVAARSAQVDLRLQVAPELDGCFDGDSARLRQVLLNLVGNGVKFTPAGGFVEVRVTSLAPSEDPTPVCFEVCDTGIGMDEATLARVFDRFTQADDSSTRRYGGTGLGLTIGSRLVALMGGRLDAESEPGRGSRFHFTLQLPRSAAASAADADGEAAAAPLGLQVLIVEDNLVNRTLLNRQLHLLGCRATAVVDGAAALAALERDPLPDALVMDCHMPNLDGWETTRRIRGWAESADPKLNRAAALPVIALTAAAYPEERARCRAAGMNAFLSKPVKLAELRRALAQFAPEAKSDDPSSPSVG